METIGFGWELDANVNHVYETCFDFLWLQRPGGWKSELSGNKAYSAYWHNLLDIAVSAYTLHLLYCVLPLTNYMLLCTSVCNSRGLLSQNCTSNSLFSTVYVFVFLPVYFNLMPFMTLKHFFYNFTKHNSVYLSMICFVYG